MDPTRSQLTSLPACQLTSLLTYYTCAGTTSRPRRRRTRRSRGASPPSPSPTTSRRCRSPLTPTLTPTLTLTPTPTLTRTLPLALYVRPLSDAGHHRRGERGPLPFRRLRLRHHRRRLHGLRHDRRPRLPQRPATQGEGGAREGGLSALGMLARDSTSVGRGPDLETPRRNSNIRESLSRRTYGFSTVRRAPPRNRSLAHQETKTGKGPLWLSGTGL